MPRPTATPIGEAAAAVRPMACFYYEGIGGHEYSSVVLCTTYVCSVSEERSRCRRGGYTHKC